MSTQDAQAAYDAAIGKAYALQAEKDAALAKVKDKYGDKLRSANDAAAVAHKALLDAQAAGALLDRPDGEAVAEALGLTLPN